MALFLYPDLALHQQFSEFTHVSLSDYLGFGSQIIEDKLDLNLSPTVRLCSLRLRKATIHSQHGRSRTRHPFLRRRQHNFKIHESTSTSITKPETPLMLTAHRPAIPGAPRQINTLRHLPLGRHHSPPTLLPPAHRPSRRLVYRSVHIYSLPFTLPLLKRLTYGPQNK